MPTPSRPKKRMATSTAARAAEVLDVHMAAEFLMVSPDTIYDLFARGDLPGRKVGRKWLTTKGAVLKWLEQSTPKESTATDDDALVQAIENGDRGALVEALQTGKARIRRKRQTAR